MTDIVSGIQTKEKYRWAKQPNGRYVIFHVPIFKIFDDEKRGSVTENDAPEILAGFSSDRGIGYYPRIHVEHQDEGGSRPGAGFLDNIKYTDGIFYSDFVEIPESIFQEIQDLKYPYRSVEYDPSKKKIRSLAIMESRSPYFTFPVLSLESFQDFMEPDRVVQFDRRCQVFENVLGYTLQLKKDGYWYGEKHIGDTTDWVYIGKDKGNAHQKISDHLAGRKTPKKQEDTEVTEETGKKAQRQKERAPEILPTEEDIILPYQDDELEKPKKPVHTLGEDGEEEEEEKVEKMEEPENTEEIETMEDPGETGDVLTDIKDMLKIVLEHIQGHQSEMGYQNPMGLNPRVSGLPGSEPAVKKPMPIAMSDNGGKRKMDKIDRLEKMVAGLTKTVQQMSEQRSIITMEQRLKDICARKGMDFSSNREMLMKFSTDGDRENFLSYVESQVDIKREMHPATRFAQEISSKRDVSKTLQQFSDRRPHIRGIAERAEQDYHDTVDHPIESRARAFVSMYPTVERFVQFMVDHEEADPGHYDRFMTE